MSYTISKTEPIGIYGGGSYGKWAAEQMLLHGYNVVGIIDRNPLQVRKPPVSVYSLDEYTNRFGNTFVRIVVATVLQHIEISSILKENGIDRILFLPMQLRSQAARYMMHVYNEFRTEFYESAIPSYDELFLIQIEDFINYENGGYVTTILPYDKLYQLDITKGLEDPRWQPHIRSITKEEICAFTPLADVPFTKINWNDARLPYRSVDPLQEQIYKNGLFGFEFFIDSPVDVILADSENMHFHILDGNHRVNFLLSKGIKGIPVRMPKDDFITYFRKSQAQALMDHCKMLGTLPMFVNHPAFVRFPVVEREPTNEFIALYKELAP